MHFQLYATLEGIAFIYRLHHGKQKEVMNSKNNIVVDWLI